MLLIKYSPLGDNIGQQDIENDPFAAQWCFSAASIRCCKNLFYKKIEIHFLTWCPIFLNRVGLCNDLTTSPGYLMKVSRHGRPLKFDQNVTFKQQ